MTLYADLDYCKQNMATLIPTGNTLSADDKQLLKMLRLVSRRVDLTFHARRELFAPIRETRTFLVHGSRVNTRLGTFDIGGYLLEAGDVSVNGSAVTVEAWGVSPYRAVRLTDGYTTWYNALCAAPGAVLQASVAGVWGFHSDYANAWSAVDALAAAIDTETATTFTVSDVDGGDEYGMTPRLSAGMLVQVDDEWLEVVATNALTNVVTVRRGVNGSTATTHEAGAAVSVWQVDAPVRQAVARQAAMAYSRRGAYSTVEAGGAGGMIEIRYPRDWLADVIGMLQHYAF